MQLYGKKFGDATLKPKNFKAVMTGGVRFHVKLPRGASGKCRYDYRVGFDSTAGVRYRPPAPAWQEGGASSRLARDRGTRPPRVIPAEQGSG